MDRRKLTTRDSRGRSRTVNSRSSYQRTTGQRISNFNTRAAITQRTRVPNVNRTDRVVNSVMPNNNMNNMADQSVVSNQTNITFSFKDGYKF